MQQFKGLPGLYKAGRIGLPVEPQTKTIWSGTRVRAGAASSSEATAAKSR